MATDGALPEWHRAAMATIRGFPNYLAAWRAHAGKTQDQVAAAAGTDKTQISKLEAGKRRLTIGWLTAYARGVNLSAETLLKPPPSLGSGLIAKRPSSTEIVDLGGDEFAFLPV